MAQLLQITPPSKLSEKERLLHLRETIDLIPNDSGIYIFRDPLGRIIYIGKAKKLRPRVQSYFRSGAFDGRSNFRAIVKNTYKIEYIITDTEVEALMLEASMIKEHVPRYNVTLKDDKKYPYLKVTNEPFPRLLVTRDYQKDGAKYLGPYSDVSSMRRTMDTANKLFKLRTCRDKLPNKSTRLCIDYEMKKCDGPCEGLISEEDYNKTVRDALRFLSGRSSQVVQTLKEKMVSASEKLEFELAAQYRDRIEAFEATLARQKIVSDNMSDWDSIGIVIEDDIACAVVFLIREGRMIGRQHYFMSNALKNSDSSLTSSLLSLFYSITTLPPREIDLEVMPDDEDTVGPWLETLVDYPVKIRLPQRGDRLKLLKMAKINAHRLLAERRIKRDNRRHAAPSIVTSLQRDLRLKAPPRRIEAIDISNTQGTNSVGSLVAFEDGKPKKKGYRHFKIVGLEGPDDYAMIKQVVLRRFKRLIEENQAFPDLLVIDGGKGQLSSALEALKELGLDNIQTVGLAKRLEEVFLPGLSAAQNIPKTSSSLRLLQHIRDESHRFAITYHRKLRDRSTRESKLDLFPGIGQRRKKDLLTHFGSLKRITEASIDEIATIPGIGRKTAIILFEKLHPESVS